MLKTSILSRGITAVCLSVILAFPPVAMAEPSATPEAVPASLQMPGNFVRKRNAVSVAAIKALGIITRTENIEDPGYRAARLVVSNRLARRMNLDAVALDKAWSRAPRDHQIAVLAALTQLGVRYIEGEESPYRAMDCSGLLWFAWRTAGVDMPRQAVSQLDRLMRIKQQDAVAGDIVGEGTHVHIYLGVGRMMVHAPFTRKSVRIKNMSEAQWNRVIWTNPSNIATYRL